MPGGLGPHILMVNRKVGLKRLPTKFQLRLGVGLRVGELRVTLRLVLLGLIIH